MNNIIYILCSMSSMVLRFNAITHEQLRYFDVTGMMSPHDIAACDQTSQLYIADFECVWRVSADGSDIRRWLPRILAERLSPWTLSVTSTRLLVTLSHVRQLVQFDSSGSELRRIRLPLHFVPRHAVQSSSSETFIVSYNDMQLDQDLISEFSMHDEQLRHFSNSCLRWPDYLHVDFHGNVLVADAYNRRVLLLDARLKLRRVIVDEFQLSSTQLRGLHYVEQTGNLLVALDEGVAVFNLL